MMERSQITLNVPRRLQSYTKEKIAYMLYNTPMEDKADAAGMTFDDQFGILAESLVMYRQLQVETGKKYANELSDVASLFLDLAEDYVNAGEFERADSTIERAEECHKLIGDRGMLKSAYGRIISSIETISITFSENKEFEKAKQCYDIAKKYQLRLETVPP